MSAAELNPILDRDRSCEVEYESGWAKLADDPPMTEAPRPPDELAVRKDVLANMDELGDKLVIERKRLDQETA